MFKDFSCRTCFYPPLPPRRFTPAGVKKSFFVPHFLVPRFPPAPSPPRGVKGGLNSRFGFFAPDRDVDATACDADLLANIGERGSRSQGPNAWRGCESGTPRARSAQRRVQGERSERAHAPPLPLGRAEQRSGDRIRAGACLSEASLRPTPGDASSARYPEGARPLARLSFAYFSLAKQRKVSRLTGRNLTSKNIEKN
jgi:hypothetical protein